ncbi:MAG TPA: type IV pilus secretin PilQ [Polyangiaceae bacterium]
MRSRYFPTQFNGAGWLLSIALAIVASPAMAGALRGATDVTVRTDTVLKQAEVVVAFSSPPKFSARLERGAKRLVIDVPESELRGAQPSVLTKDGVVAGVLTQAFADGATRLVRIWISLREDASYAIRVRDNNLVVTFIPGQLGASDIPSAPKAAAEPLARLDDLRFESTRLIERVGLNLTSASSYRLVTLNRGQARLVLNRTQLAPNLARILDVSGLSSRIERVASYVDPTNPDQVIIDVKHQLGLESRIERAGTGLSWEFFESGSLPSSMTGVARDGGVARRSRSVAAEPSPPEAASLIVTTGDAIEAQAAPAVETVVAPEQVQGITPALLAQQAGDRYAGRRIDLDLKDADIHNVLRLLADVGRVNVVTADNVQGTVTIRMRNVPWDQALDVILQAKGLAMVRRANMIRVAPADVLQKERELAIQQAALEVQLTPIETRLIPVSYAHASDVQLRAKDLLSERGSIAVDERTNMMIVRDVPGNLNQIEELVRALDTQTPQVLVEARIVEATSRYLRDVGIQWGGDATFSAATANPTGLAFPSSVGVVGGASDANTPTAGLSPFVNRVDNPNFAVNLPAAVGTGQGGAIGLTFGSIDNNINLAVRLSAAEASGMLRILSSPRVLTLDNRDARISQGTLIPFSQVSAQGVQTTFQEAKLQLLVKPHVTADGSVSMKVKINRDEPDFNQTSARGDPTILKREAETELLVMDGHTAVIGGIFTRNTGRNLDQVPFFGDIPILGLLFQRRRASDSRSELVIFLTPRIVNRAEALGR